MQGANSRSRRERVGAAIGRRAPFCPQAAQPDPKRGQAPPPPPTELKCIVMDGQTLDAAQWKTLEKIPTKQELIQKFAIAVKANPLKIARGIKMVPNKIAYAVQALADLNDDKNMTVEEAAKLKAAEGGGDA